MLIIGVTGGECTGKSTVCKMFCQNKIPVIDVGRIQRRLSKTALFEYLGGKLFGEQCSFYKGKLNRRNLRRLFIDELIATTPFTFLALHIATIVIVLYRFLFELVIHRRKFVVMELPNLFELGFPQYFMHKIITVTCRPGEQIKRIRKTNRYYDLDAFRTVALQMPLAAKCEQSDWVIRTNRVDYNDLQERIKRKVRRLRVSNNERSVRFYGLLAFLVVILYSIYYRSV